MKKNMFLVLSLSFKKMFPIEKIFWIVSYAKEKYHLILDLIVLNKGTLNFNDALMGIYAKERGLNYILSFDKDFDKIAWLKRIENIEALEG